MITIRIQLAGMTLAAALALLPAPLGAQSTAGEISGTVTDGASAALPGVTVKLGGKNLAQPLSAATDSGGSYRFSGLARGAYDLSFDRDGFALEKRPGVKVAAGGKTVENAALRTLLQATVAVTVDSGTTSVITNRAHVNATTQEGSPGDEAAAEDTTVTSLADLVIAQSASVEPVIAGTPLTYTVTVTNNGPSDARYVEVTDTLAAGVAFQSTAGCEQDPRGVPTCTLGTIPAGGTKRYTVAVTAAPAATGKVVNQVSVGAQTKEAHPGDESALVDTSVESRADLGVKIRDSVDPVIAGNPVSYTVTVTNNGPSDARGVVVGYTGTLPAGVTLAGTAGCAEDPGGAPACTLGTVPAGGSKRYTLELAAGSNAVGAIAVQVSATSQAKETHPGDESAAKATAIDTRADLVLATSASVEPVIAGTPLTYTVTVTNNGLSDARDVEVASVLPAAGVTFESTAGCANDPGGAPSCSLGTIPAGGAKRFTLAVKVDSAATGVVTYQASARSSTTEANRGDESKTEKTTVDTRADLVLTNRDSVDPVIAGTPLSYFVTVANNGPSDARNVAVAGALPAGVTFLSTAGCAEDKGQGGGLPTCTLGTIPAGTSKQYTIAVKVHSDATGVISNQASVASSTVEARPGDESTADTAAGRGRDQAQPIPDMVRAWASAWSAKRLDDYLAFYAKGFRPSGGESRGEWEGVRRNRFSDRNRIEVRLSRIETQALDAEHARVSFDQDYRSTVYSDVVHKTLELGWEDSRWRILAEREEPVQR